MSDLIFEFHFKSIVGEIKNTKYRLLATKYIKYKQIQVARNKIPNTEIQVTRLWGDEIIKTAVVHPAAAAEGCEVELTKSSSLPQ